MSQIIVFFSLCGSLVTNSFPDDPVMRAMLPALLAVPVTLVIVFFTPVYDHARRLTQPGEDGSMGVVGRCIRATRHEATRILDLLVGTADVHSTREVVRSRRDLVKNSSNLLETVPPPVETESATTTCAVAESEDAEHYEVEMQGVGHQTPAGAQTAAASAVPPAEQVPAVPSATQVLTVPPTE